LDSFGQDYQDQGKAVKTKAKLSRPRQSYQDQGKAIKTKIVKTKIIKTNNNPSVSLFCGS
jgi:hypothetical protein